MSPPRNNMTAKVILRISIASKFRLSELKTMKLNIRLDAGEHSAIPANFNRSELYLNSRNDFMKFDFRKLSYEMKGVKSPQNS